MTSTTNHQAPSAASGSDLASMASQAKSDRNRAVDFYRVLAMLAVAVGHWLAMVAVGGADGEVIGGNALSFVPELGWATWVLQVMPLFFVVGGFSSAMSLDAHARSDGRSQDWIAARLRRMLPPAVVLAATWLVVLAAGAAAGQVTLAMAAVHASAIPLWFLANYTIDTALAPFVLPRFRRDPRRFGVLIVGTFLVFEAMRIADVPVLPHVNWVLGWLAFQVLGMAWRDGLLPSGGRLIALAGSFWATTLALVLSGGPWSISMVHAPGLEHSPTNPPSLSLMTFGAAFSLTAIALAPKISDLLAARPKAWMAVVASNSMAMSIYLWHMTAAVIFTGVVHLTVGLPTATVGSFDWWMFKIPTILGSMIVLAPIVALVSRVERQALLAPRRPWNGGVVSIVAVAALTSTALKLWTSGNVVLIAPSLLVLVILGNTALRATPAGTLHPSSIES
ncbi:MAG: acyltransferase [Acidimicrobiia bacterium]|nr:acyltransferase [Acidimicrobiia bacterium]